MVGVGITAVFAAAIAIAVLRPQPWRAEIVDLPAFEENGDGLAISPDGTRLAYVSDRDGTGVFRIYVMPLAGGDARAVTPAGVSVEEPRWTRDGTALLLSRHDYGGYHVVRQPIDGGASEDLGTGVGADDCGDAIVIADVTRLVSRLVIRGVDGVRTDLVTSRDSMMSPRCDPSGRHVVVARGPIPTPEAGADLFVVDRDGGETQLTTGRTSFAGTFTPDGHSIVFSTRTHDDALQLFEVPVRGGPLRQPCCSDSGFRRLPDACRPTAARSRSCARRARRSSSRAAAGGPGAQADGAARADADGVADTRRRLPDHRADPRAARRRRRDRDRRRQRAHARHRRGTVPVARRSSRDVPLCPTGRSCARSRSTVARSRRSRRCPAS